MNAPFAPSRPPPPSGSADAVREYIADVAARVAAYAANAENYALIGDDTGLQRAMRLLAITAVHGAETLPQLVQAAAAEEALKAAARSVAADKRRPATCR